MRKIKRHDFSFGRYFHPEKSPQSWVDVTGKWHITKHQLAKRFKLVYDSYGNVDRSGRRIPARKYLMGFRPER